MNLIQNETEVARHRTVILTNNRIVQESSGIGFRKQKEIPLGKLDSIEFNYSQAIWPFVGAICLSPLSYVFIQTEMTELLLISISLIIGFIVYGILSRSEVVDFKSPTMTIRTSSQSSEPFVDSVRIGYYTHHQPKFDAK